MQPTTNPFGKIDPVGPAAGADSPQAAFSSLLAAGVNIFLIIGGIIALFFMLWGAVDYTMSGGDEEKLQKAQAKITYAVVGAVLLIGALTIWTVVTGKILGIVTISNKGWTFDLPRVGCIQEGGKCDPNSAAQCCTQSCDNTTKTCVK